MSNVKKTAKRTQVVVLSIAVSILLTACATTKESMGNESLIIKEQGSFAVGGTVITNPGVFDPIKDGAFNPANQSSEGQTLHGDHAYVFYQVPENARKLPLVFWHGHGQSAKTWETTPDGREGYQNIFLRRRFPVYLIEQPRRGRAARGTKPLNITATPMNNFGLGSSAWVLIQIFIREFSFLKMQKP
ncbi:MAG TPA: hypothetical protein VF487_21170 [Chitinophagaceae bacterium]